jgi:hypothetical protein
MDTGHSLCLLVAQTLGQHIMTVGLFAAAHLRQHIGQPIARWIKAEVEAAIAAERASVAPDTFTAAWEAGSQVDHVTAIAKGLAESQEPVQPVTA